MEEYSKSLNNQIIVFYEKTLRLIHSNHNLAIEELLNKSSSVKIHQNDMKAPATLVYENKKQGEEKQENLQ